MINLLMNIPHTTDWHLRPLIQWPFLQTILPEEWEMQAAGPVKIGPFTDMCLLVGSGAVVHMPPIVQQEGAND
jgi:hypothetical protein